MPKADCTTLTNAFTDGFVNLFGVTVFFSNAFDKAASFVTPLPPFFMERSWQGLVVAAPFALWGGYGAYRCHSEIGKASQPENLRAITNEIRDAEEKTSAPLDLELGDNALQQKTKDELIVIIKELKALVEDLQARLEQQEAEEKSANDTPLTFSQRAGGIVGEYLSHSTGFAGTIYGMLSLFWTPGIALEIVLQAPLIIAGLVSAMGETRNATNCMRINNLRDSLKQHMLMNTRPPAGLQNGAVNVANLPAHTPPGDGSDVSPDNTSNTPYTRL